MVLKIYLEASSDSCDSYESSLFFVFQSKQTFERNARVDRQQLVGFILSNIEYVKHPEITCFWCSQTMSLDLFLGLLTGFQDIVIEDCLLKLRKNQQT